MSAPASRPRQWRSLETKHPEARGGIDRRSVLGLMGASVSLATLAGCGPSASPEDIVPAAEQTPGADPGTTQYYTTAHCHQGYATGVVVTHQSARPMMVAGNPRHPASLGGIDLFAQAALFDLYDPERATAITSQGRIRTWEELQNAMLRSTANSGVRLRLLTGSITSPTLAARIQAVQARFPATRWHSWEAIGRDSVRAGATTAYGRPVEVIPNMAKAEVILAVESDLLSHAPGHLRHAHDFMAGRNEPQSGRMNRLYAVESSPSLTGIAADHRFVARPEEILRLLGALAALVDAAPTDWAQGDLPPWLSTVADDLKSHSGSALVHLGPSLPADVHALGHAINAALGAPGNTLTVVDPAFANPPDSGTLAELADDCRHGDVDTLIILGGNPAFAAPADLGFADALQHPSLSIYLGQYLDETGALAGWHVPEQHPFEQWSDARAFDGTATILQPQLRPLPSRKSALALLGLLLGEETTEERALVMDQWRRSQPSFTETWHEALTTGILPDSAAAPLDIHPTFTSATSAFAAPALAAAGQGLTVLFRPDDHLWDGRYAGNPWLQELPRPITKLSWDGAAWIAPATATQLGVATGDMLRVSLGGRSVEFPAWVQPGQAADCVTLPLGFGRRIVGQIGKEIGFDAYPLRASDGLWIAGGAQVLRTGARRQLCTTQSHDRMDGEDFVRHITLEQAHDYRREKPADSLPTLYPPFPENEAAWAMSIDLTACIGCNACALACQIENNVPVVGRNEVLKNREMHWLRIDRYYEGSEATPDTLFQPVPCMHCEHAPCEVVCPVGATVHDHEGLNVMVYNRCIGTRFCSNNCPYKVRRFNYFAYAREETRPPDARNDDVSARGRGVMEKCTYCVQRIAEARIAADKEDRPIRDGEVVTACQAACPTKAIVFGDLHDPASAVNKRKASPLDYALLEELNTRPRTTYGVRVRNPNPDIQEA